MGSIVLPPDGRASLIDQLRPPPGATLTYGVATTFTLDLTHALTAPLAFASHQMTDDQDPIAVLQAVAEAAERLDIFCQAGQMSVPGTATDLFAYLEKMVHPVKPAFSGSLFHPKIWLLQFDDGGEPAFRFLCMSRNLTGDRSWDVMVQLDSVAGTGDGRRATASMNKPLSDFVAALPSWAIEPMEQQRAAKIAQLAEAVRHVTWQAPADLQLVAFHALGVNSRRHSVDFSGQRHLVISPFCNDAGLDGVAPVRGRELIVISRGQDLDRLNPDTVERIDCCYVLDDMPDADDTAVATKQLDRLVGLHAKVYVIETGWDARILLGSANATNAAFGGNTEFLVELAGKRTKVGIDTIVGDKAPFRTVLSEYEATGGETPADDEVADYRLEQAIRELATARLSSSVIGGPETYEVLTTSTSTKPNPEDLRISLRLLTKPGSAKPFDQPLECRFESLALVDITPFHVIEITDGRGESRSTVVHSQLHGDPAGRREEILAQQVNTPEKFLHFVMLILALIGNGPTKDPSETSKGGAWITSSGALFESLANALATSPSSLDGLAALVDKLQATERGRAVLPDGFADLWAHIWEARQSLAPLEV